MRVGIGTTAPAEFLHIAFPSANLLLGDPGCNSESFAGIGFAEGTSVALFELVTEFLRPIFAAHWEQVRPGVSVDEASEWVLRAILSLLTVRGPRNRSRDGLHTFLQRFLLPAIVR